MSQFPEAHSQSDRQNPPLGTLPSGTQIPLTPQQLLVHSQFTLHPSPIGTERSVAQILPKPQQLFTQSEFAPQEHPTAFISLFGSPQDAAWAAAGAIMAITTGIANALVPSFRRSMRRDIFSGHTRPGSRSEERFSSRSANQTHSSFTSVPNSRDNARDISATVVSPSQPSHTAAAVLFRQNA